MWNRYVEEKPAEEKQQQDSYTQHEYHTFVARGGDNPESGLKWSDLRLYESQAYKRDEDGNRVKSSFSKKPTGDSEFQLCGLFEADLPEGHRYNLDNTNVVQWKSPNSAFKNISGIHKTACNSFKKWLNCQNCALWWHNGNSDLCSQYGGVHYHVVVQNDEVADGCYKRSNGGSQIDTLRRNIKAVGGYLSSEYIRSLPALIAYLGKAPRVFLGSRSSLIRGVRARLLADAGARAEMSDVTNMAELTQKDNTNDDDLSKAKAIASCESERDDTDGLGLSRAIDKIFRQSGVGRKVGEVLQDLATGCIKRTFDSIDSGSSQGDGSKSEGAVDFVIKKRKDDSTKESQWDKYIPQLKTIMMEWYEWDIEHVLAAAAKQPQGDEKAKFVFHLSRNNKLQKLSLIHI